MKRLALVLLVLLSFSLPARAQEEERQFSYWLQDLVKEAIAAGIRPQTAHYALSELEYDPSIVELEQKQPEKTATAKEYWEKIITDERIQRGHDFYAANRLILTQIGDAYGVQPRFIVALFGIESDYGDRQGSADVIRSLTSLAFNGLRPKLFKDELFNALRILDQGHVSLTNLQGSWAGALGYCQFMPSSFLKYGQDYDRDGRTDIWTNVADAAASAANYLRENGWRKTETWGREVRLVQPIPDEFVGLSVLRSVKEWSKMGVRQLNNKKLPATGLMASLILPDCPGGPAFLVYNNFHVLMRWNKSTYFATAVGKLSDLLDR